jgi:hypothetical protein
MALERGGRASTQCNRIIACEVLPAKIWHLAPTTPRLRQSRLAAAYGSVARRTDNTGFFGSTAPHIRGTRCIRSGKGERDVSRIRWLRVSWYA